MLGFWRQSGPNLNLTRFSRLQGLRTQCLSAPPEMSAFEICPDPAGLRCCVPIRLELEISVDDVAHCNVRDVRLSNVSKCQSVVQRLPRREEVARCPVLD